MNRNRHSAAPPRRGAALFLAGLFAGFLFASLAVIALGIEGAATTNDESLVCAEPVLDHAPSASLGMLSDAEALAAVPAGSGLWLLDTNGFPPRWQCGTWSATLGWIHVSSDAAIWAAYMAIPFVLGFFIFKRRTPLPMVTLLFIAFIGSCGIGHLMESVIFWEPIYRLSGIWKLITAIFSWATVIALIPIVPKVLNWPTLAEVNEKLRDEVTERAAAEERIHQIVDAAPVGMLMVNKEGTILMANHEVVRTFGYRHEELIGASVEMLVPETSRHEHPGLRALVSHETKPRRMGGDRQLNGLRRDGSKVPVDIGLNPIMTNNGPCVLATVADVTELREAENKLKRLNADLQDKQAEMEQFVYTASHDLKSPLLAINGFTDLIQIDLDNERIDRLKDFAARIREGTSRMQHHIEDLLELSRIGRVTEEVRLIDMKEMVDQLVSDLESRIEDAGATIRVEEPLESITADPHRISQVLENLVINALKYGRPDDGPFEISIASAASEHGVRLTVRDRGPGIDPKYFDKVFGLFQRLQTGTDGSGIGLAIVRRVAEIHGGRAWVESEPGHGASFHIELPFEPTIGDASTDTDSAEGSHS